MFLNVLTRGAYAPAVVELLVLGLEQQQARVRLSLQTLQVLSHLHIVREYSF